MRRRVARRAPRRHEQRSRARRDRFAGHCLRPVEVGERHVAGRQQSGVDRAELDHPAVVRTSSTVCEVEVGLVLPLVQPGVVEGVEHQLALHADEVEHPRPILGQERNGCGEVLAVHHVGVLVREELVGAMPLREAGERLIDSFLVAAVTAVAGLGEFVGVTGPLDTVADVRVRMVAQPVRRLHDVGVGVVGDPVGDVGHATFCSIRGGLFVSLGDSPLELAMNDDHEPDVTIGVRHQSLHDTDEAGFAALGLRPELLAALDALGYEEPTPIQRETIPLLLTGQDLLGQAATGTGKTAAFALPALQMVDASRRVPQVLVLVPTRELAVQVSEAMFKYGSELGIKVVPVFGGQPIGRQLQALDRGAHVVVATPGRALDHIGRGSLGLDDIRTVILDEADEMLDMGFTDDIESILQSTPDDRQTVLFSATMPKRIVSIAKRYQRDPQRIMIGRPDAEPGVKALVRQVVYVVQRAHKPSALGRILDIEAPKSALVFCRTRTEVDQLTVTMNGRGYRAEALHGGMDQAQRHRVMARLRDGTAELLVATDVAARGLDVDTLTHVVNYDVPSAAESYVHRIGRVGRAGREGVAITLAEPRERRQIGNIERLIKQKFDIAKVPTVADLRERQIEMTVGAVREALTAVDLEDFNTVLHALAGEDSDRNIALAAIKLVHESRGATIDELEIPDASDRLRGKPHDGKKKFDKKTSRNAGEKDRGGKKGQRSGGAGTAFVHVSLGRKAGVRPGDLVGAIANETGLVGREIGPISIAEAYSVVGVPEASAEHVISTMQSTTMRGKRARVRRFVE